MIMIEVGRNALCPCGSGKKYKKCCALKQPSSRRYSYSKTGTTNSKPTIQRITGMVSQTIRKIKPKVLGEKQKKYSNNVNVQSLQKNHKNKEEPFS